jgi:hypothetical protein
MFVCSFFVSSDTKRVQMSFSPSDISYMTAAADCQAAVADFSSPPPRGQGIKMPAISGHLAGI